MEEKQENILLGKAEAAEKDYNWKEAVNLYERVAKSFLDKKSVEMATGIYKKLGYAYSRGAETSETTEEFQENINYGIKAYKDAANLFKQKKNKPGELECEAEASYMDGFVADSVVEAKNKFSKSYELFIESSELYSKDEDQESIARTLSRAAMTSFFLITYCSDREEIEQVYQQGRDIAAKAWNLSKEVGNLQSLADSLLAERMLIFMIMSIVTLKSDERRKEHYRKCLLRSDESLKIAEDCNDPFILGIIHSMAGSLYGGFGFQFIEDEREQREYADKGLELMEKGLNFARKTNDKSLIINSLWWLTWIAISVRRFDFIQKRIVYDLHEIIELGKIYTGLYNIWRYYSNLLPAVYYATIAPRGFFTPDQRKSYAEKGIEFAKEALKKLAFEPYSAWPYQMLTWVHSQLTVLSKAKDEREKYAQKMLQYAKEAEKIAEKYEGGFTRAVGYSCLYRAYRTLADIAISEEERIKMLSAATEASKKNIEHAVWSRTGIIAAKMRLGFLYEELGITTGETDTLVKVRETFLDVIKESLERGYYSYAAAGHEYIARIEDRLGNHMASADHYKKAQETHIESLENIEYKPLKNRVKEKIDYACAWNLIERAKAYHKRENHLEAMENYKNACEILEKLPSYNYEALYYLAWTSLEEAEHFSKQERHQEAIESFETTIKNFNDSIEILEKALKKSKEKSERERIEKLEKLAEVRNKYCSARRNVENARILAKNGEHIAAAEKFTDAASQFRDICFLFKIEKERKELEAIFYLCRAWESMELGEQYEDPDRFVEAANLFAEASKLFADSKMKLLVSGNSAFCQALEYGTKFDKSSETENKAQLYPKIKVNLRNAAASYRKGGFEGESDWALATSAYFDAAWYLIKADEEKELEEKKKLLEVVFNIFKSASELFGKAGYKHKEKEVLEHLNMLEKEGLILVSALNTLKTPSITGSTVGIVAPACPVETSLSPRMSEMHKLTEESTRVAEERMAKIESEIKVEDQKFICIVHKGQIVGTVYICPNCKISYCLTCAYSLKANGEKCWACGNEIEP